MSAGWSKSALIGLSMTATWACGPARGEDPAPKAAARPADETSSKSDATKAASPLLADRYRQIVKEWTDEKKRASEAAKAAKTDFEASKILDKMLPDDAAYARRMVELAESSPKDPAARDALIWVVLNSEGRGQGPYADQFGHAANLLVRHHADDPEVARAALGMAKYPQRSCDALLEGIYAIAENREAKGLVRLAMAKYLTSKAERAAQAQKFPGRTILSGRVYDDNGEFVTKTVNLPNEEEGYRVHLRSVDARMTRDEADRLYQEVISEYGDIPYVTHQTRKIEALLREKPSAQVADAKEKQRRLRAEQVLAQGRTLADVAKIGLEEMESFVGKPAPEIEGVAMDGKPMKLSDYRGKVVVLVFWGTWCAPCMREVPHERELAERLKDKPFALLGVDCDDDVQAARKVMESERITWSNWNDGTPGEGPIAKQFHVRGFPSEFIIDAKGIIRYRGLRGEFLDKAVDKLLKELE